MQRIGVVPIDVFSPGVYAIHNVITDTFYIGSTRNTIIKRWKSHRTMLRGNRHANEHLQNSWNIHGEQCFEVIVLEITNLEDAIVAEQKWIDEYKSRGISLYNMIEEVKFNKQPPEVRRKMARTEMDFIDPEGNHIIGKGLHQYCKDYGLDTSCMLKIIKGKTKSYKGYTNPKARENYLKDHPFKIALKRHRAKKIKIIYPKKYTRERPSYKAEKTCEQCHKIYYVKISQDNKSHYCSKQCRFDHDRLMYSGKGNPNYRHGMATLICKQCGKEYHKRNSQKERSCYCSKKCCYDSFRTGIKERKLICKHCGKIFYSFNRRKLYCSKECKKKGVGQQFTGTNNSNYTHGLIQFECKQCGKIFISKYPDRVYCSHQCYSIAKRGVDYIPLDTQHTCRQCGKIFISRTKDRHYCSRQCCAITKRKHIKFLSNADNI